MISKRDVDSLLSIYNRDPHVVNNVSKINRFKIPYADEELESTSAYIFMVRPDLNIFSLSAMDKPEFRQGIHDYKDIMASLVAGSAIDSPFINLITNLSESFNPQDNAINSDQYGETFSGYKIDYGEFTADTTNGGELTIRYHDNKYLEVYRLHHLWVEYIRYVTRGKLAPKRQYIDSKELDYATSLYYFVVAEDGKSIVYATKLTGIFPTSIPDSAFTYAARDRISLDYDITYKWTFSENYRYINIFKEFNTITRGSGRIIPVYNTAAYTVTPTFVKNAFVSLDPMSRKYSLNFI